MIQDLLFSEFDRISNDRSAIARLRGFILKLAVHGKLVDQNLADSSASQLIKQIATTTREVPLAPRYRSLVDQPIGQPAFELPESWAWTRLGLIADHIQRGKSPEYSATPGPLVVSQKCVRWEGLDLSQARPITPKSLDEYDPVRFLREGDLLWNSTGTGTIGRVSRVIAPPERLVCDSHVTLVRCPQLNPEFIRCWLRSDHVFGSIEGQASGSTNQVELTLQMALSQPVPLPPLAEQYRIVAKVEELMELCDQLELAQKERELHRDALRRVSLYRLTSTDNAGGTTKDFRFLLDTSRRLITRSEHIASIRHAILELAIRGTLVPQDSSDEPASELLRRIPYVVKSRGSASSGDITVGESDRPFDIPVSWAWIRLGRLITNSDAGWSPKTENVPRTGDNWGVLKVSAVSWDSFRSEENKQLLPGVVPRKEAQVREGDFLISRANTSELVAKAVIVREEPSNLMLSDKTVRLSFVPLCNQDFLLLVNNHAQYARDFYALEASGASPSMKNVSRDVIYRLPIPLPPIAEQERIVAAVDKLMALCDELQAAFVSAQIERGRLLEALLDGALSDSGGRVASVVTASQSA